MASWVIGSKPTKYYYFIIYSHFDIRESIKKHPISTATKKKKPNNAQGQYQLRPKF